MITSWITEEERETLHKLLDQMIDEKQTIGQICNMLDFGTVLKSVILRLETNTERLC